MAEQLSRDTLIVDEITDLRRRLGEANEAGHRLAQVLQQRDARIRELAAKLVEQNGEVQHEGDPAKPAL